MVCKEVSIEMKGDVDGFEGLRSQPRWTMMKQVGSEHKEFSPPIIIYISLKKNWPMTLKK